MSNGNLISDGRTVRPYEPLIYTQAQVDALVKAERDRGHRINLIAVRETSRICSDVSAELRAEAVAAERDRCAKIAQDAADSYKLTMDAVYTDETWGWAMNEMSDDVNDKWRTATTRLVSVASAIRDGK